MSPSLSPHQTRTFRLRSQRLHPTTAESDAGRLVHLLCGIQAQDKPASILAVRPRTANVTAEDVRRAREVERSIVLTWAMRGTMHLISAEDVGWMLPFFGPLFIRGGQRRNAELGLTDEMLERAVRLLRDLLAENGGMTRPELAQTFAAHDLPWQGQATIHILSYAALKGVICYGADRDGEATFALLNDWISLTEPRSPEQALAELAHRYLQAYAPAAPPDLAKWAGISLSQAKAGFAAIAGDLLEVDAAGSAAWILTSQRNWLDEAREDHSLCLLPAFDDYLLGYASRDLILDQAYTRRIHPGGGIIHPSIILDGQVIGTWRRKPRKTGVTIQAEPFESFDAETITALETEVQDIGRFLGQAARLDQS